MPPIPRRAPSQRHDESAVQAAIREALGREPDLLLFRNALAFAEVWDETRGTTRHLRGGLGTGTPDLVGLLGPAGRWLSLEVKSAIGRESAEQVSIAMLIRARGGFHAVVRSVEEARAALGRARAGALS